jgi:hypothetical protein
MFRYFGGDSSDEFDFYEEAAAAGVTASTLLKTASTRVVSHLATPILSITTTPIQIPLTVDTDPGGLVSGNTVVIEEDGLYDINVTAFWTAITNSKVMWVYKNGTAMEFNVSGAVLSSPYTRLDVPFVAGDVLSFYVSVLSGTGSQCSVANISVRRSGDPF